MNPRIWYRVEMSASDPSVAEIDVIDFIGDWIDNYWGFGVTAKAFVDQLSKLPDAVKTIKVHINSPGGDVFAALNIANALRDQRASKGRKIETIVDGLAASAASIILMAGDVVRIADNALVMIHNPWTIAIGEAKDFIKLAEDLGKIRTTIVATYRWHSKLEADAIEALMDAATWMDADEAIANGFATEKIEGLQAAASLDPAALAKLTVPDKYRARVDALLKPAPTPPAKASASDILRECQAADVMDLASGLVDAGLTLDEAKGKINAAKATRQAAKTRGEQITAICTTAKLPALAKGYIDGAMTVEAVRSHVATVTATIDAAEIDTGLQPSNGAKPKGTIDAGAIYKARNATPVTV